MDDARLLAELLEAYSPSGQEEAAVLAFTKIARSLGYQTGVDDVGNGIARIGSGKPHILYLGHIDTVEGAIPVRIEGDVVHGRGACDAKGPLLAALLAGQGHHGSGEIVVLAAVGEEADSRGARHLIPRRNPDYLIVGEPSGWSNVTTGYKGNLSLQVAFEGVRKHLSAPDPTTVEQALAFVARVRSFCFLYHEKTPFASLTAKVSSITTARMGSREVVKVHVNFRLPPTMKTSDVLTFLEAEGLGDRITVKDRSEAVEVPRDNEVVRALTAGIRDAGGRPKLLHKTGTSDLNLAAPVWGCPAAAYGPGDSHLDHTDEERIDMEEFRRSVAVLGGAFRSLTARP